MRLGICYKPSREESAKIVMRALEREGDVVSFRKADDCDTDLDLDLMVIVGGDGTVIKCAKCALNRFPVVGIKAGRLGFLSSYTMDSLEDFLEDLKTRTFIEDDRWFMKVDANGSTWLALNDSVLQKDLDGRMLEIEVIVGGGSPIWFFSDGLIISTPTGSTAYNLSAGGPVVHPDSDTIQITPLLPHFMFNRGIVIPSNYDVNVSLDEPTNVLVDGKIVVKATKIRVTKSNVSVKILRSPKFDFFKALKGRLGFGRRLI